MADCPGAAHCVSFNGGRTTEEQEISERLSGALAGRLPRSAPVVVSRAQLADATGSGVTLKSLEL